MLKLYDKVTTTDNQCKIGRKKTYSCAKKRYLLSRRPYLDVKEVEILTQSDVPEDMEIETKVRVKVVELKE